MHILIVENDVTIQKWIRSKLLDWGYAVSVADNGERAWTSLNKYTYDLIIVQWGLPEMNGTELIQKIRSLGMEPTPYIILITSKQSGRDLISGIESGADDFILKPIESDALKARVMAAARIQELEKKLLTQNRDLERANSQMKNDLIVASKIQSSFLPHEPPELPGAEFEWGLLPCQELAGDALNVIRLDENHAGFYLLDVSGHGVAAALMAMTLIHLLSADKANSALYEKDAAAPKGYRILSPASVGSRLNDQFPMDDVNGQYFTCIYGILELDTKKLTYCSAGHPGPILITSEGNCQSYSSTGMPIGFIPDSLYEEENIQLAPGDRLYFFSDGIPESLNKYEEQFGQDRMISVLEETHRSGLPLRQSVDRLAVSALKWLGIDKLTDDMSVIGLEVKDGSGGQGG